MQPQDLRVSRPAELGEVFMAALWATHVVCKQSSLPMEMRMTVSTAVMVILQAMEALEPDERDAWRILAHRKLEEVMKENGDDGRPSARDVANPN